MNIHARARRQANAYKELYVDIRWAIGLFLWDSIKSLTCACAIATTYRSRHLVSWLPIGVSPSVAHVVRCFGPWLQ